jgi:plastocyanin
MLRARTLPPFVTHLLSASALLLATFAWIGCDSGGSGMDEQTAPDQISYDLTAQSNDGAVPEGVSGTVTFWRAGPDTTLVTLDLDASATAGEVSHPAHIHNNSASEGGNIAYYLSAVNGSSPNGTTARKIGKSIEFFADFDGYVNVHESPANLGTLVAQGNIGANAEGTTGSGLDLVDDPRTKTYPLSASSTNGSVFSNGVTGTVTFQELTGSKTLVTYALDTNGSVAEANGDVSVAQIGHIHKNSVTEGGGVVSGPFSGYLGSVAPTDPAARSGRIINASYDDLTSYDGYVNIHQSNANAQYVFAQGNIGANAGSAGNGADVTVTIDNVGSSAWEVTSVDGGSGVAETGTENPTLTLTVGTRYQFENNGGSAHPLGFQNSNSEYLLNEDGSGSLEDDADINYVEGNTGITFTYTQKLADAVATYRCTVHSQMEGGVETSSSDGGSGGGGY